MIESERLIFLQLQKTGCTHVARLLREALNAKDHKGKHSRLPFEKRHSGKLILGGIRNPWDWYVSFFAYACERRGGITSKYLLSPFSIKLRLNNPRLKRLPISRRIACMPALLNHELHRQTRDWTELLDDINDTRKFRMFLRQLLNPRHRFAAAVDYGLTPYVTEIGLFSYLYLLLYLDNIADLFTRDEYFVQSLHCASKLRHRLVVDRFVPMESLTDSLVAALEGVGETMAAESIKERGKVDRTNASQRNRDYRIFYDDETRSLVETRDNVLIQQHGYVF